MTLTSTGRESDEVEFCSWKALCLPPSSGKRSLFGVVVDDNPHPRATCVCFFFHKADRRQRVVTGRQVLLTFNHFDCARVEWLVCSGGQGLPSQIPTRGFATKRRDIFCFRSLRYVVSRLFSFVILQVHFNGWKSKFDEWMDWESFRLAPCGSRSSAKREGEEAGPVKKESSTRCVLVPARRTARIRIATVDDW